MYNAVNLEHIKELRKQSGYACAFVSRHLGFKSPQGYYYKEAGISAITADELGKLAAFFGVPVESLYSNVSSTVKE